MQTPKNLLANLQTRGDVQRLMQSVKHESEREIDITPDHPIWEAWLRLSEYYGSAFTFGPEPSATWVFHLQDLTADQIGHGIRNLPRHESSFPPNPGQFRDLCLCDFDWEHKRYKLIDTSHLIEDKTAIEKRNADNLAAMIALRAAVKL